MISLLLTNIGLFLLVIILILLWDFIKWALIVLGIIVGPFIVIGIIAGFVESIKEDKAKDNK